MSPLNLSFSYLLGKPLASGAVIALFLIFLYIKYSYKPQIVQGAFLLFAGMAIAHGLIVGYEALLSVPQLHIDSQFDEIVSNYELTQKLHKSLNDIHRYINTFLQEIEVNYFIGVVAEIFLAGFTVYDVFKKS